MPQFLTPEVVLFYGKSIHTSSSFFHIKELRECTFIYSEMQTLVTKKEPRKVAQRVTISNNYQKYNVPLFSIPSKSNCDDTKSSKSGYSYQSVPNNANYDELSQATDILISGRDLDDISQETLEFLPSYLDQTSLNYAGSKQFDDANKIYSLIPKVKTEINKRSIILTRELINERRSYPHRTSNLARTRKVNYESVLEKFDNDTAKDEAKLLSTQQSEMEEFDRKWKEKIPEKYRKPSQNLLLLKKKQRHLISQRQFVAAKELEAEIKKTENIELKVQQERLNNDYSRAYKQLKQKHQTEIDCYRQERKTQRFVYEREQNKQIEIERKAQEIKEIKMCEMTKRISSMAKQNGGRFLPPQNNKNKSVDLLLPKLGPPVLEKSARSARSNSVKPNTTRSVTVIRKTNYNDRQEKSSSRSVNDKNSQNVQLSRDIWGRANQLNHPNFSMKNAKEEFMQPKIKYTIKKKKPVRPEFAKRQRKPISFESESYANAEEDYYHYDEELKIDYLDIAQKIDEEVSKSRTRKDIRDLSRSVSWEAVDMNDSSVLDFEEDTMEQPSHLSPSLFKPVLDSSQLPSEFRSPQYNEGYDYDEYEYEEDEYYCESTRNHAAMSGPGSALSSDYNYNYNANDALYRDAGLFNAIPIEAFNPDDPNTPLPVKTQDEKLPTNSTCDSPIKGNPNIDSSEAQQEEISEPMREEEEEETLSASAVVEEHNEEHIEEQKEEDNEVDIEAHIEEDIKENIEEYNEEDSKEPIEENNEDHIEEHTETHIEKNNEDHNEDENIEEYNEEEDNKKSSSDSEVNNEQNGKLLFQERLGLDMGNLFVQSSENTFNDESFEKFEELSSRGSEGTPNEAELSSKPSEMNSENDSSGFSSHPPENISSEQSAAYSSKVSERQSTQSSSKASIVVSKMNSESPGSSSRLMNSNTEEEEKISSGMHSKKASSVPLSAEQSENESSSVSSPTDAQNDSRESSEESFEDAATIEVSSNSPPKIHRNQSENASAEEHSSEEDFTQKSDMKKFQTPHDSDAHLSDPTSNSDEK